MNRNNETTETFSKLWVTAMITLTMMLPVNVACSQTKQQVAQQSIKRIHPTKDWAISDFVVTAPNLELKLNRDLIIELLFKQLLTLHIKVVAE